MESGVEQKGGWSGLKIFQLLESGSRVNGFLWPLMPRLLVVRALSSAVVPLARLGQTAAMALFVNELVLAVQTYVLTQKLVVAFCLMVLGGALPSLLYSISEYCFRLMGFRLDEILTLLLCKKNAELDVAFLEDPKGADLVRRVEENGIWRVQQSADRQFYLLENLVEFIINLLALASAGGWIFLAVLLGTIPEFLVEIRYGHSIWGIWQSGTEMRRRHWDIRSRFSQLSELIEMKLFQSSGYLIEKIRILFEEFQAKERTALRRRLDFVVLSQIISQSIIAVTIMVFMVKTVQGGMQVGTFLFCIGAITALRGALSSLFLNIGRQLQDLPFIKDVLTLLDTKSTILGQEAIELQTGLVSTVPQIEFNNVSFSYPGTQALALKNVNLQISPGEKVAIVGLNGSGKTTLVKLLCRFYDPTIGTISLDKFDLRQVKINSWYQMLGVVFQEFARYRLPVKEAVALGNTNISLDEVRVRAAADSSGSTEFVAAWEKGFEQMLGKQFDDGKEPSVGQWQKLALARLFYRGSGVMILDEPTAAIDAEAEEHIFDELSLLPKDQTVILISHRFSTVRKLDRIVVFENGEIIEQGSHAELLSQNGRYAQLFELQAKGYR